MRLCSKLSNQLDHPQRYENVNMLDYRMLDAKLISLCSGSQLVITKKINTINGKHMLEVLDLEKCLQCEIENESRINVVNFDCIER